MASVHREVLLSVKKEWPEEQEGRHDLYMSATSEIGTNRYLIVRKPRMERSDQEVRLADASRSAVS